MSKILVVRSWPEPEPPGHPKVVDKLPRFAIHNNKFDYRRIVEYKRDVIQLDWDTAVSPEDLHKFASYANEDREHCLVAPCRVYPGGMRGTATRMISKVQWNAYKFNRDNTSRRLVNKDDKDADHWGFGMVYLPYKWIKAYVDESSRPLDDISFSSWYYIKAGPARITWDIIPVHLNFPEISEL